MESGERLRGCSETAKVSKFGPFHDPQLRKAVKNAVGELESHRLMVQARFGKRI